MLYAFFLLDKPGALAKRVEMRPEHKAYLGTKAEQIAFAGPLLADDDKTMVGSLLVIDFPSREDAQRWIAARSPSPAPASTPALQSTLSNLWPQKAGFPPARRRPRAVTARCSPRQAANRVHALEPTQASLGFYPSFVVPAQGSSRARARLDAPVRGRAPSLDASGNDAQPDAFADDADRRRRVEALRAEHAPAPRRRCPASQLTSRPPEVCGSVSRSRATGGSAGVERHLAP